MNLIIVVNCVNYPRSDVEFGDELIDKKLKLGTVFVHILNGNYKKGVWMSVSTVKIQQTACLKTKENLSG